MSASSTSTPSDGPTRLPARGPGKGSVVMAIEFEIEDRRIDARTHVIAVSGEVDLFTAPEFKQRVTAAIDGGAEGLVVALSATVFFASASLGVLIGAHRRLKGSGKALIVV